MRADLRVMWGPWLGRKQVFGSSGSSGSLGARSSNLTLLETAVSVAPDGVEVVLYTGLGELPHFDPDIDPDDAPPAVRALRQAIAASDAVLIAAPEYLPLQGDMARYGHSLPGVLKKAIDWLIGSGELEGKVVAITASVPSAERGRQGLAALRQTLGAVRAVIVSDEPIARGPTSEATMRDMLQRLIDGARVTRQRSG
jgi:chromate reductase, NAD(P)H dehydrogenase (quinone)